MLYKAKLYLFSKRVKESERVPFRKNFLFLTHSSLQQKQISKKNPNRISVAVRKYILLTRYFILFLNVQTKGIQTIGPQKNGQKGISIAILYLSDAVKRLLWAGAYHKRLSHHLPLLIHFNSWCSCKAGYDILLNKTILNLAQCLR